MKFNDPRLTLIAGLAMAINLNGSEKAHGAGATTKKTVTLAKAQWGGYSAQTPNAAPNGLPPLSPTPVAPATDPYQGNSNQNSQPITPGSSPITTVPLQLGTQPLLTPVPRQPMGMFYGEQERLDSINNPSPRPLPSNNYPGSTPVNQYPLSNQPLPSYPGSPVESLPPSHGIPENMDGSGHVNAPMELASPYGMPDRFGFAPPPGTLGQTYKRRSRPLEENKHPRVGIVEVNLPEGVDVTAKGLKVKWTGKVWRLESDSLMPGIPHIYEVKATWGEGTQPQYRTVRLIMGRIVDLDF